MLTRDYIMRMIQQLAVVLARLLKLKQDKQYDLALREIGESYVELLGVGADVLEAWDAETLARLLGHPEKMKTAALLMKHEGEFFELVGDEQSAAWKYHRALELFLEAGLALSEPDADCAKGIAVLKDRVDQSQMANRYQAAIHQITGG